jgi:hypothetical protein
LAEKKGSIIPKLFKKKEKTANTLAEAEKALCSLAPDVREKIEKEIRYYLSMSHTPQQILAHLEEAGHPADKFAEYVNHCYLSDFIKDSFTRGFSIEQIREELETWNWPKERIEWGISTFLKGK